MTKLQDKVAIVTGGSRDIGRAVSVKLAAEGAKVVVNYNSDEGQANETLAEIESAGGTAIAVKGDMTEATDVAALVAAGFKLERVSPIVESPAMLPPEAEPAWNKPYLNIVISGDTGGTPAEGLAVAKKIESYLGRGAGPRWIVVQYCA